MKKYINPEIEVVKFSAVDIITTSGGGNVSTSGDCLPPEEL